jgi:hypothetical protein
MKIILSILALCLLLLSVQAQDEPSHSFCINFYKKKNYKEDAGVICGSISEGGSAGSPRGNMTVGSFKTNSFLQVTLFEGRFFSGQSHVYSKGSQKNISPPIHVGSVKYKHIP